MKTWIGTSGFQYTEWKGNFYPEDLPASKMLPYFAERLHTSEINYTFHRIPSAKTIENWKAQTPEELAARIATEPGRSMQGRSSKSWHIGAQAGDRSSPAGGRGRCRDSPWW